MKKQFPFFWSRLSRSASRWQPPAPTDQETYRLATDVLRTLRDFEPNPWIWWTPLARNAALGSILLALVSLGFRNREEEPSPMGANALAASFVAHSLRPVTIHSHE
ncbi:MAG: hypothetical protein AAF357_18195 [Verrucomicrobiota bacterium]